MYYLFVLIFLLSTQVCFADKTFRKVDDKRIEVTEPQPDKITIIDIPALKKSVQSLQTQKQTTSDAFDAKIADAQAILTKADELDIDK